jgi:hypothetical protein
MSTRIENMLDNDDDDTYTITDENGVTFTAVVIANDGNSLIANCDLPDRWRAVEIIDGEYHEHAEGDTFGVSCQDEYVVRRMDNAGSLEWVDNDEGE